jgi:hypothetical protein
MLITIPGVLENGVIKISELPQGIAYSKVFITLLPQEESEETWEAMKLSGPAFEEWDNEVDSVYDIL